MRREVEDERGERRRMGKEVREGDWGGGGGEKGRGKGG